MQVNGLPLHVLLVHAVVVLVPLTALLISLAAVWPAARRRIGFVGPLLALVTTALVPVTVEAGEWLADRLAPTPLIEEHEEIGETLLPFVVGMLLLSVLGWLLHRRWDRPAPVGAPTTGASDAATETGPAGTATGGRGRVALAATLAVVTVAVSAASTWQVYRIGESGAKAVWTGSFSEEPR